MKRYVDKFIRIIDLLYQNTIYIIFGLFVIWLTFLSGFSTSYLNNHTEHTYYVKDNIILNIGVIIVVLFLVYFLYNRNIIQKFKTELEENDNYFNKIKKILLCIIFIICLMFAICAQTIPHADFMMVMKSAQELKNGNYTRFYEDGYIGTFPNQIGIVIFLYFFSMIFGEMNFFAFQLLNAISITIIYKELSDISKIFGMGKLSQLLVLIFGIIFLPYLIFVTFIYGTVLGLALALISIKYEMLFVKEYKLKDAVVSCFCIVISTILKDNYLIMMIAVLIYAFVALIRSHQLKRLMVFFYIVSIIVLFVLKGITLNAFITVKTDYVMGKGASSWSWIAMGLQDNTSKANGWYNGYNVNTYKSNNYNTKKQEIEAKAYIRERINFFWQNKKEALRFFGQKFASQWNDPNFECFNILYQQGTHIVPPKFIQYMKSVGGSDKLSKLYDRIHFIVIFGCFAYIILDNSKKNRDCLLLQMIVVGGFLFHMIWEAKTLYVLPYFIIMVPLSIRGYSSMLCHINCIRMRRENQEYCRKFIAFVLVYIVLAIFINIIDNDFLNDMIKIDRDTKIYLNLPK